MKSHSVMTVIGNRLVSRGDQLNRSTREIRSGIIEVTMTGNEGYDMIIFSILQEHHDTYKIGSQFDITITPR